MNELQIIDETGAGYQDNNTLQVFQNSEFGEIRTLTIDGEPWFVGRDVAGALGYAKPHDAVVRHVDFDDTLKRGIIDNMGRNQQTTIINESGLYTLIIMSELPTAKKFKRWVTKEVIPTIIRTGTYNLPQLTPNELILQLAQSNVALEKRVAANEQEVKEVKQTQQDLKQAQQRTEDKLQTALSTLAAPRADMWKAGIDSAIKLLARTYNLNLLKFKGKLYKELETTGNISLGSRKTRLKNRLKKLGITRRERETVTMLDVISTHKDLRLKFEDIVQKYQVLYAAKSDNEAISILPGGTIEYVYNATGGEAFQIVTTTIEEAREACARWLIAK